LVVTRAGNHPKYRSEILQQIGAQTFVGYPLVVGQKIIGALGLAHPLSIEINDETTKWIESLANYVAALTEQKRAEEELRSSHEQLRELSMHLQSAIEEERKRIAREIHDELGQELSLLQLELGLVESELSAKQKETRKKTRSMSKLINSAIKTVQRISSDLRPTVLDNLGIGAAVEWQTKEFQKRTKIKCDVTVDPPEMRLDQDRSTAFFRILQEALTNVARHSRATKVRVYLREQDRGVELAVSDNGVGIDPESIGDSRSFGLLGMRERVYQLGGLLVVSGKTGKGTQVSVTIPMKS
jgi:signal transduction histidine kinase